MLLFRIPPPPLHVLAGVAYLYGLLLGSFGLAWSWLFRGGVPDLEWWQLALGPLLLGGVAFTLEAAGTFLAGSFREGQADQPRWKHAVALVVMFLFLAVLLLGPAFYQLSSQ